MKTKFFLFILFLLTILSEFGFTQITFQKTYGGTGDNQSYCIQQTTDGGYIITATSNSMGLGYKDILIIKTNAHGDTLWTKTMGSSGIDVINSVRQTTDGGFIFAGIYAPPPSYSYVFLMKSDSTGNILWSKAYGNNLSQNSQSVQQTSDGGYILCGNFVQNNTSNDYLLMKTDASGFVSWAKAYGSNSSDVAYSVEQTNDGGFAFAGFSAGSMELIKTDANGNFLWSKYYGSGIGTCIHQTTDGGYALVGYSSGGFGASDIILKKTDSNGDIIWANRYGGINEERGHSFVQTSDGGYIISGTTIVSGLSQLLLIKTDATGGVLWSKVFGSSGFSDAGSVLQAADGGYAVLGKYGNSTNNSVYLVKTDSSGTSGCNQADTTLSFSTNSAPATPPGTSSNTIFISNVIPLMSVIATPPTVMTNTLCFTNSVMEPSIIENEIAITPNPSNGNFNILLNTSVGAGAIEIFNSIGQTVYLKEFVNTKITPVNLANVVSGIYFVKVNIGESSYCRKIIIEHD